ncbi:peptide ABC transporter ATP-binding protein [Halobacteriales archaeon SW_5_70_135]|nr:MAG: peptide ABC transporter ATP-binding protein [Halobacteriales archaeon SW_5_70_135]
MADELLEVENLRTQFDTDEGTVHAVDGVDFSVGRDETVCIVGESGSGKTVASESVTKLIRMPPGRIDADAVRFDGTDIYSMSEKQLRQVRGRRISNIFQNPQGALNPVYTVGWQIVEAVQMHSEKSDREARERAVELLDRVGLPNPGTAVDEYPHELSGGQKQRVIIAMALASEPDLLIADEPTTALDVTIQAQILDLIREIQEDYGMSVLFITHDLGVVAEIADRVVVMYAGKVMEKGDVYSIFENPSHPYTKALLNCLPGHGDLMGRIGGSLPSPLDPPDGCRFADRCDYVREECRQGEQPPLHELDGTDHRVSCVYYAPGADPSPLQGDADGQGSNVYSDGGYPDE